jgi:CO dehydrogenase/acetyl-CoA synthase beta subunit
MAKMQRTMEMGQRLMRINQRQSLWGKQRESLESMARLAVLLGDMTMARNDFDDFERTRVAWNSEVEEVKAQMAMAD